jgi:hypothetical protein
MATTRATGEQGSLSQAVDERTREAFRWAEQTLGGRIVSAFLQPRAYGQHAMRRLDPLEPRG